MKEVKHSLVIIVSLFFFSAIQIAEAEENFDTSPEVLSYFFELFSDVGFGYDSTESAGWIIRREKGYQLVKWPSLNEKNMQVWDRGFPVGAVALAHTHPTRDIQKPSDRDIALAKRIKIPVFTICRAGIWKVTSDGAITKIQPLNWFKEMKSKKSSQTNAKTDD